MTEAEETVTGAQERGQAGLWLSVEESPGMGSYIPPRGVEAVERNTINKIR